MVAMRGWLNDMRSYVPPVQIGEKMRGASLATVIISKIPTLQPGDKVIAFVFPFSVDMTDIRIPDGVNTQLHLTLKKWLLLLEHDLSISFLC